MWAGVLSPIVGQPESEDVGGFWSGAGLCGMCC